MYPPDHYREDDYNKLIAFVEQYHFASITAFINGVYHVAHVPIIVKQENDQDVLYGHLASNNPLVAAVERGTTFSLTFNGPHCFVSSTWYDEKQASTWNYMMVTIEAEPELLSQSGLPGLLNDLIEQEEGPNKAPTYEDLPEKYTSSLLPHITGIRFHIKNIRGVFKLSQNKTAKQRQQIITALKTRGDAASLEIAEWMEKIKPIS